MYSRPYGARRNTAYGKLKVRTAHRGQHWRFKKQSRAKQSEAKQGKAEQSKAKQTKQSKAKVKQSKAKQGKARQSKAKQSRARQSKAKQSKAKQSKVRQSTNDAIHLQDNNWWYVDVLLFITLQHGWCLFFVTCFICFHQLQTAFITVCATSIIRAYTAPWSNFLLERLSFLQPVKKFFRARILAANKAYSSLQTIFRSKQILRNNKIRLYKTLIKPILCYGSVTWTLTQTAEQMLNTFERKILRRIYGTTQEGGRWSPRWNSELYSLYNGPNIVEGIQIRRLGRAGHIIRTEEERITKKVLNGNFYTTRPVGRPRTRWSDVVQRDASQLLGIRGRWRRA